ncbi:MAG: OmpH family outer membrane protein [Flavobacteriaceae bacterium]
MRSLKSIVIAALLLVTATSSVVAQSKVAHINVQQLLADMPDMKSAQAELKKLEATYKADIEASVAELQKKFVTYQNEANSKTAEENKARADELQAAERNIASAEQAALQELQKKQQELFAPISDKAKAAIEKVAAAQGFDYVIDASPGLGLIVASGSDILADVKRELGF